MDAMQFARRAKEDPQLRPFLQEVADDVDKQVSVEEPEQFTVTGVDFLFFVAAYALFRWLKDYFDRRKEMYVTEMVERQADVVVALTKEGIPPKVAQAVVVSLGDRIAKRTKDDPVLKGALGLIGEGE